MFHIRTIKTTSCSTIEDIINNFEFHFEIIKSDQKYKVTLSHIDPISKERNNFGEFFLSEKEINEILNESEDINKSIKNIVFKNPDIVNKLF